MASHRRTLAAATATILASVSLYPIFIGTLWFWAGAGAVAVVAVAGTLTRLRRLPPVACLAGGVAGLLLYLNVAFESDWSWLHLVPTRASLSHLLSLAGQGFTQAAKYAPPVPQLHGMLLLAAAGIGLAALLTDLIAVRLESAALAGLPLLLLFTEPFTLSVSRGAVGTTITFCLGVAGYLAMLSSEGRDRIREWEQPSPRPDELPDTSALAAAGRRVGVASVVLALCVPLFIPGLHATRLFGGGPGIGGKGGHAGGVGFPDPNTQLSKELHTSQAATVLQYKTTDPMPQYFQIYVLDNLTGSGWQMASKPTTVPVSPRLPAAPGLTSNQGGNSVTTTVTVGGAVGQDAYDALPVPYPATAVSAPGSLRADPSSLMVFDSGVRLAGLKYTVTSINQSPPPAVVDNGPAPPSGITSRYLQVPAAYDSLGRLADSVVRSAGAKTAFQDAVALQDWLAGGGFKYTLKAPTVTDAGGLTTFLYDTKQGYCQQFSFAMAVLARLLGIPSRVAYGFTAGAVLPGGTWVVTTHDAHAWPELYFQGFGWLRFEPTPQGITGQGTATSPTYTFQPSDTFSQNPLQTLPNTSPTSLPGAGSGKTNALGERLGLPFGGASGKVSGLHAPGRVNLWEVFGLCLLGLLVLAAVAPACARLAIRRHRWRKGLRGDDAAQAHAAWRELRADLTDYGVGYLPSESPRALAARASGSLELAEPARAALRRIAMAEERARYAASPDRGAGLRQDSATVRRAIAAAMPRRTRWRARLVPSSVLTPTLAGLSQASDIFGRLNLNWPGKSRLGRTRLGRTRSPRAHAADPTPASRREPPVPAGGRRP